jgi:hypothetical protein
VFIVDARQTKAEIKTQAEMDAIVGSLLGRGYSALLRSFAKAGAEAAQLRTAPDASAFVSEEARRRFGGQAFAVGDLMFRDGNAYVVQPLDGRFHVWEIRRHDAPSAADLLCSDVEAAIRVHVDGRRVRGMDFAWKKATLEPRYRPVNSGFFQEGRLETKKPEYTDEELSAAKLLSNGEFRSALLRLSQVGKVRPADTMVLSNAAIAEPLVSAGLVLKETLVSCRQDSHTICVVPDRSHLDGSSKPAMRCTVCGRTLADELMQEVFAVTDLAKRMLNGSHWMTVWVTHLLCDAGLSTADIAWNAAAGQDELDIIVNVVSFKVFFELKDREFGLGDTYPFAARVNRYGGTFGVVATTDKVAQDARSFLDEQRASGLTIFTLEGPEKVRTGLPALLDSISRNAVRRLLADLSAPLGTSVRSFMDGWMEQRAREPLLSAVAPQVKNVEAALVDDESPGSVESPSLSHAGITGTDAKGVVDE